MTTEPSPVEVAGLEHILREISEARLGLQSNLEQLYSSLVTATEVSKEREQRCNALQAEVQSLEHQLESMKGELDSARSERDTAHRELSSVRDGIERALRERTIDMYHAISRQDPFEQLKRLKKSYREATRTIDRLQARNEELQTEADEAQTRNAKLRGSIAEIRKELGIRTGELEKVEGLVRRYRTEREDHASQIENARRDAQQATIRDLIHQITPRRLAVMMDAFDDSKGEAKPDYDPAQILEWLVQHLNSIGLRATHRLGEEISIAEDELHAFSLDDEYRAGHVFEVTRPGFALGDDILIRARVQYLESEESDGDQGSRPQTADEEVRESAETPGTSGELGAGDDQEA